MWITFNKIIDSKPNILIDCRDLLKSKEIAPTYKLAKELNIIKGLVFSIDKLFFAIYFLKNLDEFENSLAVIKTLNTTYYISDIKIDNSYKIKDIIISNIIPNKNDFQWIYTDIKKVKEGRGLVQFNDGYIIFEDM